MIGFNSALLRKDRVKEKISKVLTAAFLVSELITGASFGFIKIFNRKYWIFLKLITITTRIIYISSLYHLFINRFNINVHNITTDEDVFFEFNTLLYFCSLTTHCSLYLVVLLFERYTLFDFMIDLQMIDDLLLLNHSEMFGLTMAIYLYGMFVLKTMSTYVDCANITLTKCNTILQTAVYFQYYSPTLCIDSVALELYLIYYYLFNAINFTRKSFENSTYNVQTLGNMIVAIANCFDKIKPHFDRMLLIELMLELPKLLHLLWGTLVYINLKVQWTVYIPDYFLASHLILQIILPCYMAHKINSQWYKLKLMLHEELLQKEDDNPDIRRLVKYLDARQLDHKLWGVIPVDLQLPAALFSLCTTYFIVIIQFTHILE